MTLLVRTVRCADRLQASALAVTIYPHSARRGPVELAAFAIGWHAAVGHPNTSVRRIWPVVFIPAFLPTETENHMSTLLWTGLVVLIHLLFIARAILRPHREPASRLAWVVVMLGLPVVGILAYLLLGETSIGRRRAARLREVLSRLPDVAETPGANAAPLQPA